MANRTVVHRHARDSPIAAEELGDESAARFCTPIVAPEQGQRCGPVREWRRARALWMRAAEHAQSHLKEGLH
eukprot:12919934-Prorocentrum_lima.AAC.1